MLPEPAEHVIAGERGGQVPRAVGEEIPDRLFVEHCHPPSKTEAGYNATYFLQMLSEAGPTETPRRLIHSPRPSEGFTALWERGRLDLTVEAYVLQEPHLGLFTDDELERARRRLEEYGYTI